MRIFKNAWFGRFTRMEQIADTALGEVLALNDAQLALLIAKGLFEEVKT